MYMFKGAFLGSPGPCGFSAAAFAGGGFKISAFSTAGPGKPKPGDPREALEYPSIKSLLAAELQLDFAAISLQPEQTCEAVLAALERGLHVICSSPPCLSSTEFETLRGASEKAGRIIFIVQPWEHAAPWLALSKALTRGLAGEVNYAEVQALLPGPAPEGGALAALGWEAASMLLAMVRRPPSAVEARLSGPAAALHVHFGGADGFLHLSCGAHAPRLRAAVSGDKGRIELDGNLLRLDIKGMAPETVELRNELVPGACNPEWLAAELSDFKKEIEGGRESGSGLRNARYCVKLLRNASYSASVKSAAIPL